ncbi:MAG TPA: hypothetical protein PK400_00745, partial [Phycisphaerales bacterium]|nr:hypothetical protein [Phycisphaerales bacterium]
MLIVADLSGIQEYLFQVREVGGKQARSLRFRSFFIQLVSEAIAIRLLHATGLQEKHIIISAAGKIAIDGSGLTRETLSHVHDEARTIELWLRDNTHARLRVNIICHDGRDASMPEQYLAAGHALRNSKLRGWSRIAASSDGWQSSALLATAPPDPDAEADRDAVLGRQLAQSSNRYIVFENSKTSHLTGENWDVAGLRARFMQHAPTTDTGHYARQLDRLARHVPRDNGEAIEFVDLAKRSRGAPMLAVLKADVDSLGQAITERLRNAANLEPLRNISNRLDNFFAHKLDRLMASDPQWKLLYTVFSGGDDLLLVGPWNTALDFAGHLHAQFMEQFRNDGLTLSAGVAIVK